MIPDLLLQDLSGRLPYRTRGVYQCPGQDTYYNMVLTGTIYNELRFGESSFTPYLRPLSSMTDWEKRRFERSGFLIYDDNFDNDNEKTGTYYGYRYIEIYDLTYAIDWLNRNHFDYRGLIEKGLAIKATKETYRYGN